MQKNEVIQLDATLLNVIDDSVFSAELDNGHRFVALAKEKGGRKFGAFWTADRVSVEFSPFDMSVGRILFSRRMESEVK